MLGAWRDERFGRTYALDLMGIEPERLHQGNIEFADHVRDACATSLADATLYVADDDMSALMDVAAPTMPDQVLQESDMLSPHGWLWFATPLPDRTGDPPEVPFKAIQWTLLGPGHPILDRRFGPDVDDGAFAVMITTYCDTLEQIRARRAMYGEQGEVDLAPGAPGIIPVASVVWQIGSPIGTVFGKTLDELRDASGVSTHGFDPGFYQRALAAFWTLAKQPLAATTEEKAARPDRRRSARAGVTNVDEPVRVVRLRSTGRSSKEYESGTGRHVSVRFPVRGFWRNQYLPSTGGHRQQWIAPYMKGPVDGPLAGGDRVFLAEGKGHARPGK